VATVTPVFAGLFAALALASAAGYAWPLPANFRTRVNSWWVMIAVGAATAWLGREAAIVLFALLSAAALIEFAGYGWWLVLVPAQFAAMAASPQAALVLPLLCLTPLVPRAALMLCVWSLSWIAALPSVEHILFFVLAVQSSDVLQYLWGKTLGRHAVAPVLSPAKTWEGLAGGVATASLLGAGVHHLIGVTPLHAVVVALLTTLVAFGSGLVFSAVKRQRKIKDWGTAIAGHGGVLDRVDSLCLAAPVFYALTLYAQV